MKSFASDEKPIEIEDLHKLKCLSLGNSNQKIERRHRKTHIIERDNEAEWFEPTNMDDFYSIFYANKCKVYKLVSGNTSVGVFKNDGPYQVFIDLQRLTELYAIEQTPQSLIFGSSLTLGFLIFLFNKQSAVPGFEYLAELAKHFGKIANTPVRNVATWSGNLAMKYYHLDFPSDVTTIF
jgi:xanthine dehydrogenase iron-sulfur cluster and FAD-binding subunit A